MRPRRFAIGDPQASFSRFLQVLAHNELLGSDERLAEDVFLVAIGDYFDFGAADKRHEAASSGLELLTWLSSHSPDQVVLVAGNHDLGRIGELANFSDAEFAKAHALAREAYQDGDTDSALESQLLERFPDLPNAELAARDFAAFAEPQRELIVRLLKQRRLCLAHSVGDRLFCHAGITNHYLASLGLAVDAGAAAIASGLNQRLYDAFDVWTSGPLAIPSLHTPGHSTFGEGVGMLYHRPANPALAVNADYNLEETMSRRYDARDIPLGLTQIVGHISDKKCRQLLGADWTDDSATPVGAIRHMVVRGEDVRYAAGPPASTASNDAVIVFIDGGMSRTAPSDYELYAF